MSRLIDLDPHWFIDAPGRSGMGISFECPVHLGTGCRLGVAFKNPMDGGPPSPDEHLWQRTGETFETLTLFPSVDASRTPIRHGSPCWHGWIKNGQIE